LTLWFAAIQMMATEENGISSVELARRLGVKQQTAWTMKQKILVLMDRREGQMGLTGGGETDNASPESMHAEAALRWPEDAVRP